MGRLWQPVQAPALWLQAGPPVPEAQALSTPAHKGCLESQPTLHLVLSSSLTCVDSCMGIVHTHADMPGPSSSSKEDDHFTLSCPKLSYKLSSLMHAQTLLHQVQDDSKSALKSTYSPALYCNLIVRSLACRPEAGMHICFLHGQAISLKAISRYVLYDFSTRSMFYRPEQCFESACCLQ